jgi:hypothetical protein
MKIILKYVDLYFDYPIRQRENFNFKVLNLKEVRCENRGKVRGAQDRIT